MTITRRIQRNVNNLERLAKAKSHTRRRTISDASHDLIMALVDAARSLLKGHLSLTPRQLSAAKRHRRSLEKLAKQGTSLREKKRTLQTGGFIGALLGPLLKQIAVPVLGGLLGGING